MNKIILSFTLLVLSFARAYSFEISEVEMKRLELVSNLLNKGQREVWPTLDWKDSPLIITFESGHYFAFHLNSSDPEWNALKIKGIEVQAASQDKWGLKGLHMQAWFEIEGKQAFVYRM